MTRALRLAATFLVAVVVIALVIASWRWLIVHLSQETGTSSSSSRSYQFWSGFGSDLAESTLVVGVFAGVWGAYRKANCHSAGCPWLAHHEYEMNGATYKLCRRCHPAVDHENRPRREHFALHHHAKTTSQT